MASSGMLVGWNRANQGKETVAIGKFGEYVGYLNKLVAEKHIEGFEPVLLRPHGGDLNGFFLIRGDAAKLAALRTTDQWKDWEVAGSFYLTGFGVIECALAEG